MITSSPRKAPGFCLAGLAAVALVAPAGARITPVDEAAGGSLARSSWGAAATAAKRQARAAHTIRAERALLAQYSWGAAATYAKLHS
jgi:hypothetical protein